ncbi:MAG: hypothetical protein HQL77_08875 [Magnetococcales bacterium]|nr:hypothetical protein [Magnetococcales bacterium]
MDNYTAKICATSRASLTVFFLLIGWVSCADSADVVVIVNKSNPVTSMSSAQVSDLYLGRSRTFPDGSIAHVIDHAREAPLREEFFRRINGMPLNKVNTFWARLAVSGQIMPPVTKTNSGDVILAVQEDSKAIGYVEDSPLIDGVVIQVLRLHD